MAESENKQLSNVKMSGEVIVFSPETQTAELTLTNLHQTYFVYFKVRLYRFRSRLKLKKCLM